jgi:predicted nuclease of restriction endonuclease-like (RecB) superfamily
MPANRKSIPKNRNKQVLIRTNKPAPKANLFDRVVSILEEARSNVVRAVNSNMVIAYWLIGREIVLEVQGGAERAEYGKQVIENLSARLLDRYGGGYSEQSLQNFRKFYLAYPQRIPNSLPDGEGIGIGSTIVPAVTELAEDKIPSPSGRESAPAVSSPAIPHPSGGELVATRHLAAQRSIQHPTGSEEGLAGFSPLLSWSHYRALMRVEKQDARKFYEREAAECGWSKTQLERQIHTAYYERILKSKGAKGLLPAQRERLPGVVMEPVHGLKSPYVLEFLNLPDSPTLHESDLEQAIIGNLQAFLLELGKGFSFVARQKHIRFDEDDFYVDLVFYNYIIKCFLLIDLKMGKLTHRDVGQMDGYVRLFEDRFKVPGDNPTIGLILCSDKGDAVARYSVLKESRQLFAAKYLNFLPSEEELRLEINKERRLIDASNETDKQTP